MPKYTDRMRKNAYRRLFLLILIKKKNSLQDIKDRCGSGYAASNDFPSDLEALEKNQLAEKQENGEYALTESGKNLIKKIMAKFDGRMNTNRFTTVNDYLFDEYDEKK